MAVSASWRTELVSFGIWLVLVCAAAAIGSLLTMLGMPDWYATLAKPAYAPPDWLFAPVWTILYLSMAMAAWLVWRSPSSATRRAAVLLFLLQLVLNVAWCGLFFALRWPAAALVEIVLLWVAVIATATIFWRVRPLAGALIVPYALWTTVAVLLNLGYWQLNS